VYVYDIIDYSMFISSISGSGVILLPGRYIISSMLKNRQLVNRLTILHAS